MLLQHYNDSGVLMINEFGCLINAHRAELRLTLRECAFHAEMDPGNLSRIERGRAAPPQDPEILDRLIAALELTGAEDAQRLRDVAATQNGRIPHDIVANEEVMAALPLLLRTVNNKQLNGAQVEKLVEIIRKS